MAESAIRQFVIWSLALFALCLFRRVTRRARTSCPEPAAGWDHQVTGEVHTRYTGTWQIQIYTLTQIQKYKTRVSFHLKVQSGASCLAKHGGAYFLAVYGFIKDPIAAPGPYENQEC